MAEDHIANMFNITVAELEEEDHIWQLAEEFYWKFMIDNFQRDDGTYQDEESATYTDEFNLQKYIYSLIRLTVALMDMVNDALVDIDKIFDQFGIPECWTPAYIKE